MRAHPETVETALFAEVDVELVTRGDGSLLLRTRLPLEAYANDTGVELERWASLAPQRTFLAERQSGEWVRVSYADMLQRVRAVASALVDRGLGKQTPIAILSENSLAHATFSLAAQYVGIPVAPISPAYSTQFGDLRKLKSVLDALGPHLVFAERGGPYGDALRLLDPAIPIVLAEGELAGYDVTRFGDLLDTPVSPALAAVRTQIGPDDVAKILFTSGSTGDPKGVINTYRMLCSNQAALRGLWPLLKLHAPVLVDWLPWHHTFGGNHNFNIVLFNGGTLYIDEGRPVPGRLAATLRNLADVSPTLYLNVPRGHALIVEALEGDAAFARAFFANLQLIVNAAAALPESIAGRLQQAALAVLGREVPIVGGWGSTETAPSVTAVHFSGADTSNVGLPNPATDLLLVPTENGKHEARVRGPGVTPGYWRRADLSALAFDEEGFYKIGDALRFVDAATPARGLLFDGRLAEQFKITTGTWIDGGVLRLALVEALAPFVDEIVVAGENRDDIRVLVFPPADPRRPQPTRTTLGELLWRYNQRAGGSSNRVAAAIIAREPLSAADGELTDKGSINQRRVLQRRSALVERLYQLPDDDELIVPIAPAAT